jgi:hypothetical protein
MRQLQPAHTPHFLNVNRVLSIARHGFVSQAGPISAVPPGQSAAVEKGGTIHPFLVLPKHAKTLERSQ